jgi:hypothetical protein
LYDNSKLLMFGELKVRTDKIKKWHLPRSFGNRDSVENGERFGKCIPVARTGGIENGWAKSIQAAKERFS